MDDGLLNGLVERQSHGRNWTLFNGDSALVLPSIPTHSIHFSIFSPPFSSLYAYTATEHDLGNVKNAGEFFEQLGYITRELLRVLLPGRVVAVHTYDIQQYANTAGMRHRYDFPGDVIRHMESVGFAYKSRITINKNPQSTAIRNHPVELMFRTLRGTDPEQRGADRANLAPAQADYVLIFQSPGNNPIPISDPKATGRRPEVDEETWIKWAAPVWTDIRETDVLSDIGSKANDDERHLCPLQLPVIERCIKLWSNPGEIVLTPFAGIGSEVYGAIMAGRRGVGIELKNTYYDVAVRNCQVAELKSSGGSMFDLMEEAS